MRGLRAGGRARAGRYRAKRQSYRDTPETRVIPKCVRETPTTGNGCPIYRQWVPNVTPAGPAMGVGVRVLACGCLRRAGLLLLLWLLVAAEGCRDCAGGRATTCERRETGRTAAAEAGEVSAAGETRQAVA